MHLQNDLVSLADTAKSDCTGSVVISSFKECFRLDWFHFIMWVSYRNEVNSYIIMVHLLPSC